MSTIFSHAIFASSIGSAIELEQKPVRFWVLTSVCSLLPDADVIGFVFRINYGSIFGHRGITHSLFFALLVGIVVSVIFFRRSKVSIWKIALYFSIVTFSHPLLDMLTDGGLGVALLAPFSNERFFFPWRPVMVSPIGAGFFSERGLATLASEIVWIWLPCLLIVIGAWLIRRQRKPEGVRL
jgi:inner membrane protein